MKVLLVNPLWSFKNILPINLVELAGYVRENSQFNISIIDLNYELKKYFLSDNIIDKAVSIVNSQKPDIIGLTCNTIHVPFCAELCKAYKKKYETPIVLGGIHPTFRTDAMFKLCGVDYIVRGEGEETFLELLNTINKGSDVSNVKGLSYKYKDNIYHNPDRPLIKDLSNLPFPAYDLLLSNVDKIRNEDVEKGGKLSVSIIASRGCPYRCIFCSANRMWKYQRRETVDRVIKEIEYLKLNYKCDYINFEDDCLPLNKNWFDGLLCGLKKLQINWGCFSRIDVLDGSLLGKMEEAGCNSIFHGIESANTRVRKLINKKLKPGINNEVIIELIRQEINLGIDASCSFMIGIPTETEEEIYETIEFAYKLRKIGATIYFWIMTPYPDTEAVQLYKDKLIKIDRWKVLKQFDVFNYSQFFLYNKFYERYYKENPDFYMFKPEMEFKKFIEIYKRGRKKIGFSAVAKNKLYNYFIKDNNKKYFISIDGRRLVVSNINTNVKGVFLFISIDNKSYNFVNDKLIARLKKLEPKNCFISIDLKKKDFLKFRNKIIEFLKELKYNNIKFTVTKPIPHLETLEQKLFQNIPKNCEECYEMFKVNNKGELELCTGTELFPEYRVPEDRAVIYELFLRLGILELENQRSKSLCYNFPIDKKGFQDLEKQFREGINYVSLAKENFLSGDIEKSVENIDKIINSNFCIPDIKYLILGIWYKKNKNYEKAITELKIAKKIYVNEPQINFLLADCYKKIGKTKQFNNELKEGFLKSRSKVH